MQIFLARDNKQAGPYTLEQLNTMLTNGQVKLSDLAWHEGMENWLPLDNITGGQLYYTGTPSLNAGTPSTSQVSGSMSSNQTLNNHNSHSNLLQKDNHHDVTLASNAQRIGASMLDFIILLLCVLPIRLYTKTPEKNPENLEEMFTVLRKSAEAIPPEITMFSSTALLIFILLQVILLAKRGQTIGKAAIGVCIVDDLTNEAPSFTRLVLIRTLLVCVFMMLLGMLFIPIYTVFVFLSKDGKLLYDRLAKTKVVLAKKPN